MKITISLILMLILSAICFGQSLEYRFYRTNQLEIYAWFEGVQPEKVRESARFTLIPLNSPVASTPKGLDVCSYDDCKLTLPADFDKSKDYILIIDYKDKDGKDKRVWTSLKPEALLKKSKDVNKLRDEILVTSNVPIKTPAPNEVTLMQSQIEIDKSSLFSVATIKPIEIKEVSSPSSNAFTLKLKDKLRDAVTTTASIPLKTKDGSLDGSIVASGFIETPGLPSPPEPANTQINLTNVASVNAYPIFEFSGTAAFRNSKYSTLLGRYDEYDCRIKEEAEKTKCEERNQKIVYFDGFRPSVSFDIGFKSTKSKNNIIVNAPFIFYLNQGKRNNIDAEINQAIENAKAKNPKLKITPLNIYGGWRKTPLFSLANIKLSIGPKLEFYRRYQPRNLLGSIQADFEFHRFLGTIATRRKLLSADYDSADDKKLFGQLRGLNFGWKLVPFLAFDGGRKFADDDSVEATIKGVKTTIIIPQYNIVRFYGGAVGTIEWLALGRYFGFSMDYRLSYLATTEFNSQKTDSFLALRSAKGFQPFFKTSFEFALDPAKRYSFKTTWETGRTLPTLEYLNKLSTGINISY